MKIVIVCDKKKSAIHRLSLPIQKHNPHLKIKILPFHPKRPDLDQLEAAPKLIEEADLVHIAYWKSSKKLDETFPDLLKGKPKILCHYNPYDVDKENWSKNDAVVVGNSTIHNKIPYAHLIPYGIDLDFFEFNRDYTEDKVVLMVVARIEGKKGVREVAQVCKKLGYKFVLVGRISKMGYFKEVEKIGVEFHQDVPEEELKKLYYQSAVHVCNSIDDFESGTLPILEAMACGVPVLTRNVGHVPDLYDGKNMIVRNGAPDDIEDLEKELEGLMGSRIQRSKIRGHAWQTVKNRNDKKMAREFGKLYYSVFGKDDEWASIIIPTFDRPAALTESLIAAIDQDYKNKEIIVVDSGKTGIRGIIEKAREQTEVPIKYIRFENKGEYTLPKARNLGIIESQGKLLVFCDDRLKMDAKAVSQFMKNRRTRTWLWGTKDDTEKSFVENFSAVERYELILRGAFNERIDCYGGLTQETRTRMEKGGMEFELIRKAKAKSIAKSGSKFRKKADIIKAKYLLYKLYG